MPSAKTKESIYDDCLCKGLLINIDEIDKDVITSNLNNCENDFETAKDATKKQRWNTAYKLYYDVLHVLTESFLITDKIKSLNHQCLFAYLCVKHPKLELDWNFFEKVRTKRNGINYYGKQITRDDLKEIELQINLYIKTFRKEIKRKLQD